MPNIALLQATANLIMQDFELTDKSLHHSTSYQDLLQQLLPVVSYLIDHDLERLLWVLYKIDVDEDKAKFALANIDDRSPAYILTDLIIQRELKKAETRMAYRSKTKERVADDIAI